MRIASSDSHFVFFGTHHKAFHASLDDERVDAFVPQINVGLSDH